LKFYKFQRKQDNGKFISTKGDLDIALQIWSSIKEFQQIKSGKNTQKVLDVIKEAGTGGITYAEISEKTGLATTQVKSACYDLVKMELINKDKRDNKNVFWLNRPNYPEPSNMESDGINAATISDLDLSVLPSWRSIENQGEIADYINAVAPRTIRTFIQTSSEDSGSSVQNELGRERTDRVGKLQGLKKLEIGDKEVSKDERNNNGDVCLKRWVK